MPPIRRVGSQVCPIPDISFSAKSITTSRKNETMEHMRLQVWAWRCEVVTCGHTWLACGVVAPAQCSKCKSRQWHTRGSSVEEQPSPNREVAGSNPAPASRPSLQELRQTIAKIEASPVVGIPADWSEVDICGKTWWEDGEQFECLMDKGHREAKHGLRGMFRKLEV